MVLEHLMLFPEVFERIVDNIDIIIDFVVFIFLPALFFIYVFSKIIFKTYRKNLYFVYIDTFYEDFIYKEAKRYNKSKRKWLNDTIIEDFICHIHQNPDKYKNTKYWDYIERFLIANPRYESAYKQTIEKLHNSNINSDTDHKS